MLCEFLWACRTIWSGNKKHFYEINKCCFDDIDEIFNLRQCFGKTVFLKESEAEAKLKELRGLEKELLLFPVPERR